ncbi:Protein of unknown function [Bacillus cytotoxicus]|nr:Protein of unknown function [Bacillus cytotoxicus]
MLFVYFLDEHIGVVFVAGEEYLEGK